MPLRLRLALWFAGVAIVAIISLSLAVYAEHSRAVYLETDTSLHRLARSLEGLLEAGPPSSHSPFASTDFDTLVRFYGPDGEPVGVTESAPPPPLGALEMLTRDDPPADNPLLRRIGYSRLDVPGAFATESEADGVRIRLHLFPVERDGSLIGYVQTWNSLSDEDRSVTRLRNLLTGLGVGVALVLLLGGASAAGLALRPLRVVTRTARSIAAAGDFSQRVPEASRQDELGTLTTTFNEMLDVVEQTHEAQRQFIADAAHEIRAPLAAIRGNVEILEREATGEGEPDEVVVELRSATERLAHVGTQLLALARLEAGEPLAEEDVELDGLVLDAAAAAGALAHDRRIDIEQMEPVIVVGDRNALRQALVILLDNAIQHGRGTVRVGLSVRGPRAEVSVADEGPGMSEEERRRAFDRFYRGRRARSENPSGSGLGLPIARALVERHGGDVVIDHGVDQETIARLLLPLGREGSSPSIS